MSLRAPRYVFAILLVLWIGGCANAVADRPLRVAGKPDDESAVTKLTGHTGLVSGFEHSLTKTERKAVISALQRDRERVQQTRQR
jgi:hypothetical protein